MIKRINNLALIFFTVMSLTACVTTQAPKMSHVHVGHAMTAWPDTPDEQGLFITAEQEAMIAYEHAQYAVENAHDVNLLKMHIKHVQHAMAADKITQGPGLGYGFIKAISAARDHILFAADSNDASHNLKTSAPLWSENVDIILQRSNLIMSFIQEILSSDSYEEILVLTDEVKQLTEKNLYGYDSDGDGVIGNVMADYGIKQLKKEMQQMIAREEPPYQLVDKKYLFGVIRLPSGEWTYDLNKNSGDHSSGLQY